jgi:hypothetical protein
LEYLLRQSAEAGKGPEQAPKAAEETEECEGCGKKVPLGELQATVDDVELCQECYGGLAADLDSHDEACKCGKCPQSRKLGQQSDGSYRSPVTIPEGYLSAVQEWAEAESATVEEWLDKQFLIVLESYGMPAKGR